MTMIIRTIPEWLELLSLALLVGILSCRVLVVRPGISSRFPSETHLLRNMRRWLAAAFFVMIASSTTNILMRSSEISGQPIANISSVLPIVLLHTHLGRAWLVRMTVLISLSLAMIVRGQRRESNGLLIFMLALAALIALTESASGHPSDSGDFTLAEMADWLHLLGASAWGGGLFVLSVAILPELAGKEDSASRVTADVASRFSRMAGLAVGALAIAALYNAWDYVGGVEALGNTAYGRIVMAKIIIFFILMNLGAFNRYVSVPLLRHRSGYLDATGNFFSRMINPFVQHVFRFQEGPKIFVRFKRSVAVEAVLVIGVLFCAAMLRQEMPASHVYRLEHAEAAVHSMQSRDFPYVQDVEHHLNSGRLAEILRDQRGKDGNKTRISILENNLLNGGARE